MWRQREEGTGLKTSLDGQLEGLGFFHVQKGGRHNPSHHTFWATVGLWILADQKGPKAFALSRLSFREQKERLPNHCIEYSDCAEETRAFAAFVSHGLLAKRHLEWKCVVFFFILGFQYVFTFCRRLT